MGYKFLCGCELSEEAVVTTDEEDYLVCDIHFQRVYGWRSPPMNNAPGLRNDLPDWGNFYGAGAVWQPHPSELKDIRDNRDPWDVWAEESMNRAERR